MRGQLKRVVSGTKRKNRVWIGDVELGRLRNKIDSRLEFRARVEAARGPYVDSKIGNESRMCSQIQHQGSQVGSIAKEFQKIGAVTRGRFAFGKVTGVLPA